MSGDKRRSFQRYLLLSQDSFRNALKCLEKQAMTRTMERSAWYEQRNPSGGLRRIESVSSEQLDTTTTLPSPTPTQRPPPPSTSPPPLHPPPPPPPPLHHPPPSPPHVPKRTLSKPSSIPMRMVTRKMALAKGTQKKGSGVRIFRVY